MWLPIVRTWCLSERHNGGLTALNKAEIAAKHGRFHDVIRVRDLSGSPEIWLYFYCPGTNYASMKLPESSVN
ncbi:hypothetical protein A6R68_05343, partial [Neotoma lepida]